MKKLFSLPKQLLATASVAAMLVFGGCSSTQIAQVEAQIQDTIAAGTQILCGVIPLGQTVLNIAAALYPGIPLIGLGSTALTAIESEICSAAPPAASHAFRAIPRRRMGAPPVTIGNGATTNVPVVVWRQ